MKRLLQFVGIGVGLVIVVIVVWYLSDEPIYVAALLGAIPAFLIAFYDRYVNVSLVSFDKKGTRKDFYRYLNQGGAIWHYLRLPVKNFGFAPAKNCTVVLSVLKRPQKNGENCPFPSTEDKALRWIAPRVEDIHTIPPRGGTATLAVVIDDTSVTSEVRALSLADNKWGPLTVWAGTNEVIVTNSPATRSNDAFCQGDYEIELAVFPDNGAPKREKFKLHVDSDWSKTSLT